MKTGIILVAAVILFFAAIQIINIRVNADKANSFPLFLVTHKSGYSAANITASSTDAYNNGWCYHAISSLIYF